jgi:hypothetical protein
LKLRAIGTCADDNQGEALARIVQERMTLARAALGGAMKKGPPERDRAERALCQVAMVLLEASRVQRNGTVIEVSAQGKVEPDVLGPFLEVLTP